MTKHNIFAGVKILGNVKIEDNTVLDAIAVVVNDVPTNCVSVDVPAKVISLNSTKCFDKYFLGGISAEYKR